MFSSSRCLDAVLRQSSLVALTAALFALGRGDVAGELGILQMLIRGMESLFQPLVLLVMSDSLKHSSAESKCADAQRLWTALLLFSIPASAGMMLVGETLLNSWLGDGYGAMAAAFRLTSLSALPTIGAVLLRGYLDGSREVSPLAWIYAAGMGLTVGVLCLLDRPGAATLVSVSACLTLVQWGQFAVQFWMLRQVCGVRVFDAAIMREMLGRIWRRRAAPSETRDVR